ncbi:MAG TPA: porin [Steroidobacteraceae bacterium]|nr:porin [Steroidobacteraceae bacterium]
MKNFSAITRLLRPAAAGIVLALLATRAAAVDLKSADGEWTFSLDGNVNVYYIFSSCESYSSAVAISGGLTCVGSLASSSVSNIGNGLLPAAFTFGVATTQNGIDLSAHLGLYPGIATNNSGNPNIGPVVCGATGNGGCNTALGTTGLDIRQVYMTFGTKEWGTFTLGRNIGLFGADVILNDMTLPGVGAPGAAASIAPANTTLGGIGFGYIYTDWLAQMDYTTPDFSGFNLTVGAFDPLNPLCVNAGTYCDVGTPEAKKAPGFHAKATYTMPLPQDSKLYVSVAFLTQEQYLQIAAAPPLVPTATSYSYTADGVDVFAKLDVHDLEVIGYYYHAKGLGTTALFYYGDFGLGQTRTSDGYFAQATYKFGPLKVGVNYGRSNLDTANGADATLNPDLVESNRKVTVGLYYSLTKNLTLIAEGSGTKSYQQVGGSNSANTFNVGAYLGF